MTNTDTLDDISSLTDQELTEAKKKSWTSEEIAAASHRSLSGLLRHYGHDHETGRRAKKEIHKRLVKDLGSAHAPTRSAAMKRLRTQVEAHFKAKYAATTAKRNDGEKGLRIALSKSQRAGEIHLKNIEALHKQVHELRGVLAKQHFGLDDEALIKMHRLKQIRSDFEMHKHNMARSVEWKTLQRDLERRWTGEHSYNQGMAKWREKWKMVGFVPHDPIDPDAEARAR